LEIAFADSAAGQGGSGWLIEGGEDGEAGFHQVASLSFLEGGLLS